jgi:apolipoprotein D and lipocalin family protein
LTKRQNPISSRRLEQQSSFSGWQARVQTIVLIGLGILAASCTGKPDGVEPVRDFEVDRYLGKWHEVMRLDHSFERGLTNVTATYTLNADGTVAVLNRGFDPKDCEWDEAEGIAEFQGDKTVASLSVTFFWPFAGGYHVFALDKTDYRYALVSGPDRGYLWLLARDPDLSADIQEVLVKEASTKG